jgi:hypothetical protein
MFYHGICGCGHGVIRCGPSSFDTPAARATKDADLEQRLRLAADVDLRNEGRGKAGYGVTPIRAGDRLLRMLMGAYPKRAWGSSSAFLRPARNCPARAPSATR